MRPRPLWRSKRRVTLSKSEPRIHHRLPQTRAGRRAGPRHLRTLGTQAPRSRNRRGATSDAQFVPHAPHYAPRTRVTPFCIFARRPAGALVPLTNHGIPAMSMGFLLPGANAPVAWRGLMVQKAVQQLLFDVDWRGADPHGPGLDILVIDMPPGTGDVPLSLGQLVNVDGTSVYPLFFFVVLCVAPRLGRRSDRFHATGRCACGRSERHRGLPQAFHSRASLCLPWSAWYRSKLLLHRQ